MNAIVHLPIAMKRKPDKEVEESEKDQAEFRISDDTH